MADQHSNDKDARDDSDNQADEIVSLHDESPDRRDAERAHADGSAEDAGDDVRNEDAAQSQHDEAVSEASETSPAPASVEPAPEPVAAAAPTTTVIKKGGGVAWLALLLSLGAAGASGYLWYLQQNGQLGGGAAVATPRGGDDGASADALAALNEQIDALQARLDAAESSADNSAAQLAALTSLVASNDSGAADVDAGVVSADAGAGDADGSDPAAAAATDAGSDAGDNVAALAAAGTDAAASAIDTAAAGATEADLAALASANREQIDTAVAEATAAAQVEIDALRSTLAALQSQVAELADREPATLPAQGLMGSTGDSDALREAADALDARLAEVEAAQNDQIDRMAMIDRQVQNALDSSQSNAELLAVEDVEQTDARRQWLLAETEYLLQSANTALQMSHDGPTAMEALRGADERLVALDDPSLTDVRAEISGELAALEAVPSPDIEGIALTLGSLAKRVELLPLKGVTDERYANGADGDAPDEPGWQRALGAFKSALSGMVSIQRDDSDITPLLAPEDRYFLYRNLELQLESARLAALRADKANYVESLASASRWLTSRFDETSPAVQSAIATLAELNEIEVAPEQPDISGSLSALRRSLAQAR